MAVERLNETNSGMSSRNFRYVAFVMLLGCFFLGFHAIVLKRAEQSQHKHSAARQTLQKEKRGVEEHDNEGDLIVGQLAGKAEVDDHNNNNPEKYHNPRDRDEHRKDHGSSEDLETLPLQHASLSPKRETSLHLRSKAPTAAPLAGREDHEDDSDLSSLSAKDKAILRGGSFGRKVSGRISYPSHKNDETTSKKELVTLPDGSVDLTRLDLAVDLEDDSLLRACQWTEKESSSNEKFAREFGRIFKHNFSNLPWHLDEGGLIGSARAGSMRNADDDFDFFAILPNQNEPCRTGSKGCTKDEFAIFIHRFLKVFWDEGMCVRHFNPDFKKWTSKSKLMYSLQLNRKPGGGRPEDCFSERVPFAHMHLGMLSEDGKHLDTNIWIPKGSSHVKDHLPLELMLPTRRCRAGKVDVPCPNDIVGFLSVRNGKEYVSSGDGSCLLVRKNWGQARKEGQVKKVRELDACGYASSVELADKLVDSGYKKC